MNAKNKNIRALIRAVVPPSQLNVLIATFTKQASLLGKKIKDERTLSALTSQIQSDEFLAPFIVRFETFSDAEIKHLLNIYESEAMKKFLRSNEELFMPFYKAIQNAVEEPTLTNS